MKISPVAVRNITSDQIHKNENKRRKYCHGRCVQVNDQSVALSCRFLGIEEEQSKFKVNDLKARAEAEFKRLQFLFSHIYLGYLAHDNAFLQHLYENPEKLESPNKETTELLRNLIARNYRRAVRRQNVLRMRQPLYVMMFKRKRLPPGHKRALDEEKKLWRNIIVIEANFLLHRLHEIRMRRDYIGFFG
ncbi:hypothetical protein K0M31_015154 [Melipona bicolor]|uniref:Uncharacterized protein n=1 Tax=Melipona bicolor TaxID=60889 RepID=A0AA40FG87_9HYME|nr:hypothetical protein K0M31_015154 [Melipona bicolor]